MGSRSCTACALALVGAFVSQHAAAQGAGAFPNRPIRLIVPVPPGGGTDFTARTLAQPVSESIGQSVIVDNRPGAAGNIGVELAARATPDGYTIVMPITSFAVNPHLYKKLPFDTVNDFVPIALAAIAPLYLVVTPTLPATSVSELVALARAKPGQLSYANSGNGTTAHLAGELFKKMAGLDIVGIPYRGGGPAVLDLIGGRVQMYFSTIPAAIAQVRAGKLRGLAVTSAKRVNLIPEVPTVAESGLPGYEIVGWFGLFAPAGTPAPIIGRLEKEVNAALQLPDVQKRFGSQGLLPGGGTSAELGKFLRAEIARWGTLIKDIGLEAQ
ncbi:MAG: tripartite tricarboxylate transporter substrate binding protein [bacterium]|jgi:tripartite-type tricarboxylate transporter receptor subunit TctC|nr:tripartite tricarboxylate transporter substrate binding protein [Betaproteobacteria bacterium]